MARIRTLKPEFPQSESMGRVTRDARLLFVLIWTLCDDAGRTRAASRMLASLLFPYDDDAPALIDGWLAELEREDCVRRYRVDADTYIQVSNWLKHQKIDKPSPSKIPQFAESSRKVANPRERSSEDQGSRSGSAESTGNGTVTLLSSARPPTDAIPFKAIVDRYHLAMINLPKVRELTEKRKSLIRSAWQASPDRRSLAFWKSYFEECADDTFLNGTGPYRNGHEKWRPDFNFLLRTETVTNVYEKAMDRIERESAA